MAVPKPALIAFSLAAAIVVSMGYVPTLLTNPVRLLPASGTVDLTYAPTKAQLFDASAFDAGTPISCPDAPQPAYTCFQQPVTLQRSQHLTFARGETRKETRLDAHDLITASDGRVVLDLQDSAQLVRHSAFPIDEPVANARSSSLIPGFVRDYGGETRTGLQFSFPFAAEWRSYQYFDAFGHSSYPIDFQDREDFDGTTVYRFHQDLSPAPMSAAPVKGVASQYYTPAEMAQLGLRPSDAVSLEQFYSATRTIWVEPKTGTILNVVEQPRAFLARNVEEAKRAAPEPLRTIFTAQFAFDDATKQQQRNAASSGVHRLKAIKISIYLTNILALLLLVWGVVVVRRTR